MVNELTRVRLAFAGDISLNDQFLHLDDTALAAVFQDIRLYLNSEGVDFFVANLESPLEGNGDENSLKYPRLKTSTKALNALCTLKPDLLILGNNHVYDCLEAGVTNTESWLAKNNIDSTGTSKSDSVEKIVYRKEVKGIPITVLSYVAADTHPSIPPHSQVGINDLSAEQVLNDIREETKNGRFIIISLHWGIEFSHYPTPDQITIARSFIDAGAKIIMGHHTHTLQGFESYNNGVIFYSLGNFAFSDVTACKPPVLWTKDQLHGGLAIVDIENDQVKKYKVSISFINNLKCQIISSKSWARKLKKRCQKLKLSKKDYESHWRLYQFKESVIAPPFRYFFGERKNFLSQLNTVRPHHIKKIFNYFTTYISRIKR